MREWLSGRASPCQGECREFESRLPLHLRRHSQVVRQRSATPSSPVQIWVAPPFYFSRSGGTGRRTGLKILRRLNSVPVRFRSSAPRRSKACFAPAFFILGKCTGLFQGKRSVLEMGKHTIGRRFLCAVSAKARKARLGGFLRRKYAAKELHAMKWCAVKK